MSHGNCHLIQMDREKYDWKKEMSKVSLIERHLPQGDLPQDKCSKTFAQTGQMPHDLDICPKDRRLRKSKIYDRFLIHILQNVQILA